MERKFTYDEIVKALLCLSGEEEIFCKDCAFVSYDHGFACKKNVSKATLDFINSQKAENDRLADRNHKCIYLSDDETTEFCVDGPCPKFKTEAQIRAEAFKEFAERLKANMSNIARMEYGGFTYFCVGYGLIDNLVKEMTEERK